MSRRKFLVPNSHAVKSYFFYQFLSKGYFSFSAKEWGSKITTDGSLGIIPAHLYNANDKKIEKEFSETFDYFTRPKLEDFRGGQDLFTEKVFNH